jgi:hypothetical protein
MIPSFEPGGNLPAGVHWAEWDEVEQVFGTNQRRRRLTSGLQEGVTALWVAGCQTVYVDGSFVTTKPDPADYDCAWEVVGVDPLVLDPILLDFSNQRSAQKAKYQGEFFPASWIANTLTGQTFMQFSQQDRNGQAKGIVGLDLTKWSQP